MKENKKAIRLFIIATILFSVALALLVIILSPVTATTLISFQEKYQDYLGTWHNYDNTNLFLFPMYTQNGTYANRIADSLPLSIPGAIYIFNPDRIGVTLNYTPAQINSRSTADGVNWYIPIPESLYKTRFYWDNVEPTVYNNTGIYLDSSNFWYDKSSGQLRFYYNQNARTFGINSAYVIFQFSTYMINNATTSGFTTANVSLNGSRWTDDGQLALNLRNDSSLNMSNLSAYYSFDETTGTIIHNINNESGMVNTTNQGTWNGNTTLNYSTSNIGNAGLFDGVNDYVNVSDSSSLDIQGNFTVSAWFNANDTSGTKVLFVKGDAGSSNDNLVNYMIYLNSNNVYGKFGNGTNAYVASKGTFNALTWSMATAVFNGTHTTVYLNGISGVPVSASITPYNSNAFYIGVRKVGSFPFNGTIDEVRIWNRALSASEIAVLYNTSMRTQAMPLILNQTASAGQVINRTRIIYTGQDSINNISLDATQNGTSNWFTVQGNMTSNSWYSIANLFNDLDFRIILNGNGSNTPFFTSLEWDNSSEIVSAPVITNVTGNFFVNHSWTVSGGTNPPNLYNVSINSIWDNTSFISFRNNTYSAHAWQNITVCGYDSVNSFNGSCSLQNTQIPNNIPSPNITIHTTYLVDTGTTLNFSIGSVDKDGDTLVYSSNNTIGTFNITTGNFSYTGVDADAGNYTFYFKVDDGYGGIVSQTTTITEESVTQMLLAALANLPTKADVSNAGAMGLMGGIVGGAMATMAIRRLKRKTVK